MGVQTYSVARRTVAKDSSFSAQSILGVEYVAKPL